ncbi:MAG: hypothetical protein K9W43_02705 [Candidatus Thorarchaeota archaeon]|nr:hypothetical protein [Candidatus Thorarchaeota archaeon]
MLDKFVQEYQYFLNRTNEQPPEPKWPLFIPEVSDITETSARLIVRPEEGDWNIDRWDFVAWDMTGNLFDKAEGAPWTREPGVYNEDTWRDFINGQKNRVKYMILVDRLPDYVAIQTPPTTAMLAHLDRLASFYTSLMVDDQDDAPKLWIMSHGYPSYIDWPPAWHWNLGIRMLSSLAAYLYSHREDLFGADEDTLFSDGSAKIGIRAKIPFVEWQEEKRVLWSPFENDDDGLDEFHWFDWPGLIPFVPGADTHQLKWFAQKLTQMGFTTVALDAMNTIAHEDFRGLPLAIRTVLDAGAKHVFVYGPWPLHAPRKYIPTKHVTYIPHATHLDMVNTPPRFWHKKSAKKEKRSRLPDYRTTPLSQVAHNPTVEICDCPACRAAITHETRPQGIWKLGHLLHAARELIEEAEGSNDDNLEKSTDTILRYQGPSYTVFRRCLHYPPIENRPDLGRIAYRMVFDETSFNVVFDDDLVVPAYNIHWSWWESGKMWAWGFPTLEE